MSGQRNDVIFEKDFLKDVGRFPIDVQEKLADLIVLLQNDPFDARLHTKPLSSPLQGFFSFRITRDYRIGFTFKEVHSIQLLVADRRDKIYKCLQRKAGY